MSTEVPDSQKLKHCGACGDTYKDCQCSGVPQTTSPKQCVGGATVRWA